MQGCHPSPGAELDAALGPGGVADQVGEVSRVSRQEFVRLALAGHQRVPVVVNAGALDSKPFRFIQADQGFLWV